MRQEPEHFGDQQLSLVYMARKLKDALRLEAWLTEAGFDYLVEPDKISVGTLFPRERVCAFFYVAAEQEGAARDALRRGRFKPLEAR